MPGGTFLHGWTGLWKLSENVCLQNQEFLMKRIYLPIGTKLASKQKRNEMTLCNSQNFIAQEALKTSRWQAGRR
jgi:hypothetical protein